MTLAIWSSHPEGAVINSLVLDANPHSVRRARSFAAESMGHVEGELRDIVVLLVSELVSNAVLHGSPHPPPATVSVTVEVLPDRIRVEVTDVGSDLPILCEARADRRGGRGIMLLHTLASQWGCDSAEVGKTVWFEINAPLVTLKAGDDHG